MRDDRIIVRWLDADRLCAERLRSLQMALSTEERARADRLQLEDARRGFVAGHALKRATLSELVDRSSNSWRFRLGPFGKPEPINGPQEPPVRFNLSHTGAFAVVAACVGREIGVDVERLDRPAPMEVAQAYFTAEEQAFLLGLGPDRQSAGFLSLWTLKEAYMKATGRGVDLPLDSFSVETDPPRLSFSRDDEDWRCWRFKQLRLGEDHIAAVAVDWPAGASLPIISGPASFEGLTAVSDGDP